MWILLHFFLDWRPGGSPFPWHRKSHQFFWTIISGLLRIIWHNGLQRGLDGLVLQLHINLRYRTRERVPLHSNPRHMRVQCGQRGLEELRLHWRHPGQQFQRLPQRPRHLTNFSGDRCFWRRVLAVHKRNLQWPKLWYFLGPCSARGGVRFEFHQGQELLGDVLGRGGLHSVRLGYRNEYSRTMRHLHACFISYRKIVVTIKLKFNNGYTIIIL